jgi:hypothetical protein
VLRVVSPALCCATISSQNGTQASSAVMPRLPMCQVGRPLIISTEGSSTNSFILSWTVPCEQGRERPRTSTLCEHSDQEARRSIGASATMNKNKVSELKVVVVLAHPFRTPLWSARRTLSPKNLVALAPCCISTTQGSTRTSSYLLSGLPCISGRVRSEGISSGVNLLSPTPLCKGRRRRTWIAVSELFS